MATTPETEHRVPVLDGWRGLAVLGVVFDHYVTNHGLNLGRFGVEMFFVLSGRLMAEILFVRRSPLTVFFPRRFSRIYPALVCFVILLALFAAATGVFAISPSVVLAGLFFTMNYTAIWWDVSPAIDHLWSLAIEEHCYLLLGALAALSRWQPRFPVRAVVMVLVVLAIGNGAWQTWGEGHRYHNVYWRTDVRGASILMSVAVFLWWQSATPKAEWLRWPWTPVLLTIAGTLLNLNAVPDPVKYSVGTLCLAVAVATLPQVSPLVARVLRSRTLTMFGVGSYSLFLWQQPFSLIEEPAWRYASLGLVALLAYASYVLVEKPARRLLNRWMTPSLHPGRPAIRQPIEPERVAP